MSGRRRWPGLAAMGLLGATLLLQGCATVSGAAGVATNPRDPWENWNRKVYVFNETVDEAVLRPVATAYTRVVPELARRGVDNFFGNFYDAWSGVNNLLQGKAEGTVRDGFRVAVNTLIGVFGLFDVATEMGLDRQREDLGQTLGVWGFGPGPYLVLPVLGSSTLRDTAALPLDTAVSPALLVSDSTARVAVLGLGVVSVRANLLDASRILDDIALDKYTFTRDAFLQRRRSQVYDGDPPDEQDDQDDEPSNGDAPAPGDPRPPAR